ncbi:sigma-54-dependent Fis family transcriptional regulator [Salibacterium salarium]|uniref:Sigma-54-dependent Fis family transcriptional regulator n=1 Tax=Salibacterium salarium TaxID=284579 RepID=A0A428MVY8_9BACI|nr:sigma-54-dependent Fis family transcriptional regulator [Salibacterium salarium]RSL30310.1 sigma-54-dependent Fis family transcriptional regulator [Salibacterium salarium]
MNHLTVSRKDMIKNSWDRCFERNLNRHALSKAQHPTSNSIKELKEENELLLQLASPVLQDLAPFLGNNQHAATLLDRKGHVIFSVGGLEDREELYHLRVNGNLQEGISWNEYQKGANAVGIALKEKNPIILFGDEHFYEENAPLTCAANPIIGPSGEVAGVINIYSVSSVFQNSSLTMGKLAAESIQHKMMFQNVTNEKVLALRELQHLSDHYHEPIISLDPDNYIIRANESAKRLLGRNCVGRFYKEEYPKEIISDKRNKWWQSYSVQPEAAREKSDPSLYTFDDIKRNCPHVEKQIKLAAKAAAADLPIILEGETGTGKEVFAQSIHSHSDRRQQPFITVNCGAIPPHLLESELFGYEKGAFTGADPKGKKGKFEAAHGGTIFLDEIGELPLQAQVALLRVLQEQEITPLGSNHTKKINVRVVAATNADLQNLVDTKQFRSDLYYRLKGITLNMIPLRERTDLIYLTESFLEDIDPLSRLSSSARYAVSCYDWPGNIRELISVLNQGSFLAEEGIITKEDLQLPIDQKAGNAPGSTVMTLEDMEKQTIQKTLEFTGGNIKQAAEQLKITRSRLYRKIEQYQLNRQL